MYKITCMRNNFLDPGAILHYCMAHQIMKINKIIQSKLHRTFIFLEKRQQSWKMPTQLNAHEISIGGIPGDFPSTSPTPPTPPVLTFDPRKCAGQKACLGSRGGCCSACYYSFEICTPSYVSKRWESINGLPRVQPSLSHFRRRWL